MENYDIKINLIIVGETMVGKTSIIYKYIKGTFNQKYLATIGIDYLIKDEKVDDKIVRVSIWDTAGQERYHSLTKNFFRNCDGIIIVYDITSKYSFEKVEDWILSINNNTEKTKNIPKILVGNKIDLESKREVSTNEGKSLADLKGIPFFETTVKDSNSINELMKKIINDVILSFNPQKQNISLEELNDNNEKSKCKC